MIFFIFFIRSRQNKCTRPSKFFKQLSLSQPITVGKQKWKKKIATNKCVITRDPVIIIIIIIINRVGRPFCNPTRRRGRIVLSPPIITKQIDTQILTDLRIVYVCVLVLSRPTRVYPFQNASVIFSPFCSICCARSLDSGCYRLVYIFFPD